MSRVLAFVFLTLGSLSASAQTVTDLNEGLRIHTLSAAQGTHQLSWFGHSGRAYFLLQSNDEMESWAHVPMMEAGTGSVITWGIQSNASRSFFKLQHLEGYNIGTSGQNDSDGDGVVDLDELLAGSNPFDPPVAEPDPLDSDGDGWDDDNDIVPYDPDLKGPPSMTPSAYALVDLGVGSEPKLGTSGHAYWKVSSQKRSWPNEEGEIIDFNNTQLQGALGSYPEEYGGISPAGVIAGDAGDTNNKDHAFSYLPGTTPVLHAAFDHEDGDLSKGQWGPEDAMYGAFYWSTNNPTQYLQGIANYSANYSVIRSVVPWEIPAATEFPELEPGESLDVYAGEYVHRDLIPVGANRSGWIEDLWETRFDVYDRYEDDFVFVNFVESLYYQTLKQRSLSLRTASGTLIPLLERDLLTEADVAFTSVSTHQPLPWLSGPAPDAYPLWMIHSPADHLWVPDEGSYEAVPIYANREEYESGPSLEHIYQVNGQGMATVYGEMQDGDHGIGVWTNGSVTALKDLLPLSNWQQYNAATWYIRGLSDQGMILAEAKKLSDNAKHILALIPGEPVVRDASGGQIENGWLANEVRPKPEVKMYITGAQMTAGGVQVSVRGTVYDELSSLARNAGDRVSQLHFSVFGQALGSVSLGSAVGVGQSFSQTLVIPHAQATSYTIRAETSENKAGETGWDEVAVSVGYTGGTMTSGTALQMHVLFGSAPSPSVVDTAVVFFGGSAPSSGGVVTETGPDTGEFIGTAIHPEGEVACTLSMDLSTALNTALADILGASATITLAAGQTRVTASLLETGVDTRVFVISSSTPVFNAGALRVVATANLNGQRTERGLKPFTVRIGAPEAVALGGAKLSINGTLFDLEEFQDGEHTFLYPVDPAYPGEPREFLAATGPVPAHLSIPGYASTGETQTLDFRFLCLGQETTIATVQVEPGEEAFGSPAPPPPPPPSGGSGWQEPGDEVTMADLLLAFRLLYGDAGQDLLYYFEQGGGVIQLGDVLGDLDVDVWNFGAGTYIQIENDDAEVAGTKYHPGVAAQLLWNGLNECLAYHHIRVNIPVTDLNALIASRQAVSQQACQTGIAAAELYLSGIGVASDGVDLVLTINEVAEGNYVAIAGALPFLPASLFSHGGKVLFRNTAGQPLDFIQNAVQLEALQNIYRIADPQERLRVMGVAMEANQFRQAIGRILTSGNSPIQPYIQSSKKHHDILRERMEALQTTFKPFPGANAHHDLPWEHQKWFAAHGLDVNDPAFGRWVGPYDHVRWHGNHVHGKFNDNWLTFINQEIARVEQGGLRATKQQILDKLAEMRTLYTVTNG